MEEKTVNKNGQVRFKIEKVGEKDGNGAQPFPNNLNWLTYILALSDFPPKPGHCFKEQAKPALRLILFPTTYTYCYSKRTQRNFVTLTNCLKSTRPRTEVHVSLKVHVAYRKLLGLRARLAIIMAIGDMGAVETMALVITSG